VYALYRYQSALEVAVRMRILSQEARAEGRLGTTTASYCGHVPKKACLAPHLP